MAIAIIGGSGFSSIDQFKLKNDHNIDTPYGSTSAPILEGDMYGESVFFLARHGKEHTIQPHKINYRANIYALKQLGVSNILALAAVGGITENCQPGALILPHQILDYTYGREMTYFDQEGDVQHAEFSHPYSEVMRDIIIQQALNNNIDLVSEGVCAVTQGPRFETAAEITRYKNDGATIVGMTAMPEAILARELGIAYITVASSVNYAAGVKEGVISHDEIHQAYSLASSKLYGLLSLSIRELSESKTDLPDLIKP